VRQSRLTTGCKENGGLQARDNGEPFPWLTKIHSIACEPKSALGVKSLGGLHKRRRRSKCYVSARHAEAQPPNPNPGIDPRHAGRVFHQPAPTAMSFDKRGARRGVPCRVTERRKTDATVVVAADLPSIAASAHGSSWNPECNFAHPVKLA
jgi:hypothetical protein